MSSSRRSEGVECRRSWLPRVAHGVGVHAGHTGGREEAADVLFEPLRARATLHEPRGPAFRAVVGHAGDEAAAHGSMPRQPG